MDEKTPIHQYKPLGLKTLYLLILKRGTFLFIVIFVILAAFLASKFIPVEYTVILANIILTAIVVGIISVAVIFYLGWLEYIHYGVFIEENSFRVTKGMFSEHEIGVPYRFIQEVRLERSIVDIALGVSNINIMILGEVEGMPIEQYPEINLPSIDKKIASEIQEQLLNKSGARKVVKN